MDSLINTGQLSHFKQQDNKTVAQCSSAVNAAPQLTHFVRGPQNSAFGQRDGRLFLFL